MSYYGYPQPSTWTPSGIQFTPNFSPSYPCSNLLPVYLPLLSVVLESCILSTSTRTTLTQTFHNPSPTTTINNAHYTFPLYANCCVLSFICHIGPSKIITGIVKPRSEAQVIYDTAVRQGLIAGLLEQKTPEIFKTQLGNIPPGVTVKVVLEYVTELKHDPKVDGILFTVPTVIAPRYGVPPAGAFGPGAITSLPEKGISLSISVTMSEPIRTLQSTSHPISVTLGTHLPPTIKTVVPFNPNKALATLHQPSTALSTDFTLTITTTTPSSISTPHALLESHPTLPTSALMLTLVPRFTYPPSPEKPDIVFLVDRSGSMADKVIPLKAALRVFLKSLPVGCRFNIVFFGSYYRSIWQGPVLYTRETLSEAQNRVDALVADMGGTELFGAVKGVLGVEGGVKRETELMVLTDGEVWGLEELQLYVGRVRQQSGGKVRVFTLGLGRNVSHALVEGLARVGGGTSVILPPGEEETALRGRVVGILKCALGVHVGKYSLQIEYETEDNDGYESDGTAFEDLPTITSAPPAKKPRISLFSPGTDLHRRSPTPTDEKFANRFGHLKALSCPVPLQAPYDIPQMFPLDRTTVYVVFPPSPKPRTPRSVTLQATTIAGDELYLSIPITRVEKPNTTIHALAARAQLRDLEEGRSWVHESVKGDDVMRLDEYVEREGEKVGVEAGIAGKWTSFIAIEKGGEKEIGKGKNRAPEAGNGEASDGSDDAKVLTPAFSVPLEEVLEPEAKATRKRAAPGEHPAEKNGVAGTIKYVYDSTTLPISKPSINQQLASPDRHIGVTMFASRQASQMASGDLLPARQTVLFRPITSQQAQELANQQRMVQQQQRQLAQQQKLLLPQQQQHKLSIIAGQAVLGRPATTQQAQALTGQQQQQLLRANGIDPNKLGPQRFASFQGQIQRTGPVPGERFRQEQMLQQPSQQQQMYQPHSLQAQKLDPQSIHCLQTIARLQQQKTQQARNLHYHSPLPTSTLDPQPLPHDFYAAVQPPEQPEKNKYTLQEKVDVLIDLQQFDGSYVYCARLVEVLSLGEEVKMWMKEGVRQATAVVAVYFEEMLGEWKDVWMLVVDKAWVFVEGKGEREEIEKRAVELVRGEENK